MKYIVSFLLIACVVSKLRGQNINLPKSNYCDSINPKLDYLTFEFTDDEIFVEGKKLNSLSEISAIVANFRDELGEMDTPLYGAKIIGDKDCAFSKIDSVFYELRQTQFLKIFLKVSTNSGDSWIEQYLPPSTIDEIYQLQSNYYIKESFNNDSIKAYVISSIKGKHAVVNDSKILVSDLLDKMTPFLSSRDKKGSYIIKPNPKANYQEFISMLDIFKAILLFVRNEYARRNYNLDFMDLNSEDKKWVRYNVPGRMGIDNLGEL